MTGRGKRRACLLVGLALSPLALAGCGAAQDVAASGAVPAAPVPAAAGAGPGPARGSGIVPPTLRTYGAKLSERTLPVITVPLRLRVPSVGVDGAVTAVGVAGDGQLAVPDDAGSISWYRFGSGPGGAGTTVLAGHVDYDGSRGVFWRLDELQTGQRVELGTSAGPMIFVVTATRRYAKPDLPLADLFGRAGPSRLVLITCGGSFDRVAGSYRDNVVVYAEPVTRS